MVDQGSERAYSFTLILFCIMSMDSERNSWRFTMTESSALFHLGAASGIEEFEKPYFITP